MGSDCFSSGSLHTFYLHVNIQTNQGKLSQSGERILSCHITFAFFTNAAHLGSLTPFVRYAKFVSMGTLFVVLTESTKRKQVMVLCFIFTNIC